MVDDREEQSYNVIRYNGSGKNMLSENLLTLRKIKKLTQEQAAEAVGVSRQALAKWESGETVPDVNSCIGLAGLYGVSLDELVSHSRRESGGLPVPPKGKHLFGVVNVGEKGQIVIPKKARALFGIGAGDRLMVLGDEEQGLALLPEKKMLEFIRAMEVSLKEGAE